ncbi:MAG: ATP-dependent RecD-like DNA helicase [Candidatus Aminicenantales bacterium]
MKRSPTRPQPPAAGRPAQPPPVAAGVGLESLEGTIELITFYNTDNGYTVCRFVLDDGTSLTVVGSFPPLSPGERLKVSGRWEVNNKYGRQFKAEAVIPLLPASAAGVEKFLSSGLIKGIGPVLARRILKKFGSQTLDLLGRDPGRLLEVSGVGQAKLAEIKRSWAEHRDIRDLIIFLQEHNVSTSLATKIYRQYGQRSYQVLRSNPYQLCLDIWGIGFKTADQIALKLGLDPASLERVKAFLLYLLEKDNEQGHIFSYQADLEAACLSELGAEADRVAEALAALRESKSIVVETTDQGSAVYLPFLHHAEEEVVRLIQELADSPSLAPPFEVDPVLAEAEKDAGLSFSEAQRQAIRQVFRKKILVITGGPGTGKTTIIKAVAEIYRRWGRPLLLAAPTGRAAKRLSETTGGEAKTLHRLLEYTPKAGSFKRNERRPLAGEALVVDEFSMVDLTLLYQLLRAVPAWMRLVFVGDKDQLPSVGPGSLLRDIIASERVAVVRLDEIFRQEKDSLIVLNAHRINQGQSLLYPPRGDKDADFYFLRQESEEGVFKTIVTLACYSVPRKLGLPALSPDIQVISPMYRGLAGVDRLNEELQKRLNPAREGLRAGLREFRINDKVMQVRNDYEKDVFNGDIGLVCGLDRARYRLFVDFDGRQVSYEKEELADLTLAYAVSVHKAQGSEYQAVIMPLMTQHFIMLQRNLFYTALTRAKKLSMIVGSAKALYIAIKNDKPVKRNSLIRDKLSLTAPRIILP